MQLQVGEKHPHYSQEGSRPFLYRSALEMATVLGTSFSTVLTCFTYLTALLLTYYSTYFNLGLIIVFFTILIIFFATYFCIIFVFLTILVFYTTFDFGLLTIFFFITILLTIYLSFLKIVSILLTVLVSYFICVSIFFCICISIFLTVLDYGLTTCYFLLIVFISQRVRFLVLFLSSVCTWQYLCRWIWSAICLF